jgi:hypothetical protein
MVVPWNMTAGSLVRILTLVMKMDTEMQTYERDGGLKRAPTAAAAVEDFTATSLGQNLKVP